MSEQNVEVVRLVINAAVDRAWERVRDLLAPECEWRSDPRVPGGSVYQGRDQVLAYLQEMQQQALFETRLDIHDISDRAQGTLAIATIHARGERSGLEVEMPWSFLFQIRDGKVTQVRSFLDQADALEAAGLSQ